MTLFFCLFWFCFFAYGKVYKNYDPRARILKHYTQEVFDLLGRDPLMEVAEELERIVCAMLRKSCLVFSIFDLIYQISFCRHYRTITLFLVICIQM